MEDFNYKLQKAIDGDIYYMWCVAYAYMVGDGVERNPEEATKWYQKCVDADYEDAAIDYAKFLYYGEYVVADKKKSMDVVRKFAEQGKSASQEWLAYVLSDNEYQDYENALYWREKAAEQDNIDAIINMGLMYKSGRGVQQSYDKALAYLKKAVDKGIAFAAYHVANIYHEKNLMYDAVDYYMKAASEDARAQYMLGVFYMLGENLPYDINKAIEMYEKAAEQNYPDAQAALGTCYESNEYGIGNGEKAKYWFEKAINNGVVAVWHNLGNMYMNGEVIAKDMDQAIYCYQKSAECGSVESQRWLAQIYRTGDGVEENPELAFFWEKKAVDNGRVESITNLASYYFDGYGVERDVNMGMMLMTDAAEKGDMAAQFNLGNFYRLGEHVEVDNNKAIYWYDQAANKGDDVAMNNLAWMYEELYKNPIIAHGYYLKAAELGNPMAQFNLAMMYKKGEGIPVDYKECYKWLMKTAESGDGDAYLELGVLYEDGLGVEKDYVVASQWYEKAILQDNPRAMCYLAVVILNGYLPGDRDIEKAKSLLIRSNSLGYARAADAYNHFFG